MMVPSPIRADGCTRAVGSTYAGAGLDREQQLRLGDHAARRHTQPPAPSRAVERRRPSVTSSVSRSPGTTCRRNLALLTPRSETRAVGTWRSRCSRMRTARHLRQRLDHQDRRHHRRAGKVSLEEIFVDREVLERDEPGARLVLPDRVDQK